MKRRSLFASIAIVSLAALLGACASMPSPVELYGSPAPVQRAERSIVITPQTQHVNVEGGEVIRFVAGGKEFAWHFNVAPRVVDSFALNEVAPPGFLDQTVRAYVAPDPRYWNIP